MVRAQAAEELVAEYSPVFFERFEPITALDMVQQVPGFRLDNGSSDRGFVAAVGNILINGVYPSAKQDSPSSILARIPAGQVTKIERIRGQVRDIDLHGQPVVVNVTLSGDFPAVVRWDLYVRHHSEGPAKPGVDLSLSDRWRKIDYNAGAKIEREANGESGNDLVADANGVPLEAGSIVQESTGIDLTGTLNASALLGNALARLNSRVHYETRNPLQTNDVRPLIAGGESRRELIGSETTIKQFEIGMDAVRNYGADMTGTAILLYSLEKLPRVATREIFDANDNRVSSTVSTTTSDSNVFIARMELDWHGIPGHHIQFDAEAAFESLDGTLVQSVDTGAGPVNVDVPGANTRVEEVRGDFLLKDSWSRGLLKLDYGIGAEVSTLTQTGDTAVERDFFFLKPEVVLTYALRDAQQTRFRAAREVSQLDFDDFITATVFEDDDLSLGNPDLRPDTTWVTELSHEWRLQYDGVLKLTAYHHWISDVLDLLPLTSDFESPGNIGDGRRWGIELESTLSLVPIGLAGAKLDLTVRLQDSVVVDPVTGEDRVLSAESGGNAYRTLANFNKNIQYYYRLDYRQDLPASRIAWGWTVAERDERTLYRVDELDVNDEGYAINAFIETTRWKGLKLSLVGNNLLNFDQTRDRTIFAGERQLTPVDSFEYRERFNGRRFTLTISGSF